MNARDKLEATLEFWADYEERLNVLCEKASEQHLQAYKALEQYDAEQRALDE